MPKENYRVDSPVRHDNTKFAIGDTIALEPHEAAPLLGYKVISRFVAAIASAAADSIGKTAMALDKALKVSPATAKAQAAKAARDAKEAKNKASAKVDPKAKSKAVDKKATAKVTKKAAKEGSDIPEKTGSEQGASRVESEASSKNTDFQKSKDGPEG